MNNENVPITLEELSGGLLKKDFNFQVTDYIYVEKRMNTPADRQYSIPVKDEDETNAVCAVSLSAGILSVEINDLRLNRGNFPNTLSSKIHPHHFNMTGKEGDDFRILIVPLMDMSTNPHNNYRAEFIFDNGLLTSIGFNISMMDSSFRVFETELMLYGNIIH